MQIPCQNVSKLFSVYFQKPLAIVCSIDKMATVKPIQETHIMKALLLLAAIFAITSTILHATPTLTTLDSCNTIAASSACKLER